MILKFLPSQLLEIASEQSLHDDPFSQWAYKHIAIETMEFFNQNPEIQWSNKCEQGYMYLPEQEKDYYLEFDGYWMLICNDEFELRRLLLKWYQQKTEKMNIYFR